MKSTVSYAVAAILSGVSLRALAGQPAPVGPPAPTASAQAEPSGAPVSSSSPELKAVIVTAQKYAENLQNVPLSVQVLDGQALQQLGLTTQADFIKDIPNLVQAGSGPGQGTLYFRGLSTGADAASGSQAAGIASPFPNVVVYLDEEPAMLPGRDLDVYAVDLQRIETLEGPQGTLFGAGAQAGVVRYITNKPKLDAWEVDASASRGVTAHGDPNNSSSVVFNAPLLEHKLAARLVLFQDHEGGYINNVPATFARSALDLGLQNENGGIVPTGSATVNNFNMTGNAINPVDYTGLRFEVLYKINDDWDVLLSEMVQNMDAQGVFYDYPNGVENPGIIDNSGVPIGGNPLPDLSVNLFEPSYGKDRFENTAVTVHGAAGPLSLVYDGSYLVRNVEEVTDYTAYARGPFAYYYQCTGVSYSATSGNRNATCFSPASYWRSNVRNTELTQEVRVSTPQDWWLRDTTGLFWNDYDFFDDTRWAYTSVPECSPTGLNVNCMLPVQPFAPAIDPSVGDANTTFIDDFTRTLITKAAYTRVSLDIIPHKLTISGGVRYFDMYQSMLGGTIGQIGCKQSTPTTYFGPCLVQTDGTDVTTQNPHEFVETGKRGMGNLSLFITPDAMLYYTYSQGFRPGGFNRGSERTSVLGPDGVTQFLVPKTYESDDLTNNEIGWKTLWWHNRVRFNGALYQETWSNVQSSFFCPQCGFGQSAFLINGPQYRVRGGEAQITGLFPNVYGGSVTAAGSASVNSGELVNSPKFADNNPASVNFGKPITERYVNGVSTPEPNLFGNPGDDLANNPPLKWNLRVRYDRAFGDYLGYIQGGVQHQAQSTSGTGYFQKFEMPSWTTYDASVGVSKDAWTVSVIGTNLTNVTASLETSDPQFIIQELPIHPRTIELVFSYQWLHHE